MTTIHTNQSALPGSQRPKNLSVGLKQSPYPGNHDHTKSSSPAHQLNLPNPMPSKGQIKASVYSKQSSGTRNSKKRKFSDTRDKQSAKKPIPHRIFPLFFKISGLIILAAGIIFLWINSNTTSSLFMKMNPESPEAIVLNRYREDIDKRLMIIEREISRKEALVSDLENQRSLLTAKSEALISERELELQNILLKAVTEENKRLAGIAVPQANITTSLSSFEAEMRTLNDENLKEFRLKTQEEEALQNSKLDLQLSAFISDIAAASDQRNWLISQSEVLGIPRVGQGSLNLVTPLEDEEDIPFLKSSLESIWAHLSHANEHLLSLYPGASAGRGEAPVETKEEPETRITDLKTMLSISFDAFTSPFREIYRFIRDSFGSGET